MATTKTNPLNHPEVQNANPFAFIAGYAASVILMAAGLIITIRHTLPAINTILAISLLAALTLLAQAMLLFRLDFSRTQQWKTASLVLVLPLFVLSIGLTSWMFHTLYPRTMLDFMQVQGAGL